MKLHFLVPHAQDEAPGQRLKFEQYYERFRQEGFEVIHDTFYSSALYRRLGRPGLAGKLVRLALACVKRLGCLWTAWRSDVVYLFLEAVPAGPPMLEWIILRIMRRPLVYDIDDLIYLKKPGSRDPFPTLFNRKGKVEFLMKNARHVIVCTPHLEKEARRLNDRVTRISSTIDTVKYPPKTHYRTEVVTLGWSGSFSTAPYLHLLDGVLRALQQRYGVAIRVIGDAGFAIPGATVEVLPWKLESEVKDLLKIDIGLYPLPHEEWVLGKSGLKALQYMGLGIPTVLAPIGANLEIVEHGRNGFFADSEEEWLDALTRLVQDPALRERIGKAGRATVEERYSVAVNWPLYREAVRGALAPKGRP
jgi:glycosyltransferase involved in cell wall biosynthesis